MNFRIIFLSHARLPLTYRHSRLVAIYCRFLLRNKALSMLLLSKVHYGGYFGFLRDRVDLMMLLWIRRARMIC